MLYQWEPQNDVLVLGYYDEEHGFLMQGSNFECHRNSQSFRLRKKGTFLEPYLYIKYKGLEKAKIWVDVPLPGHTNRIELHTEMCARMCTLPSGVVVCSSPYSLPKHKNNVV